MAHVFLRVCKPNLNELPAWELQCVFFRWPAPLRLLKIPRAISKYEFIARGCPAPLRALCPVRPSVRCVLGVALRNGLIGPAMGAAAAGVSAIDHAHSILYGRTDTKPGTIRAVHCVLCSGAFFVEGPLPYSVSGTTGQPCLANELSWTDNFRN